MFGPCTYGVIPARTHLSERERAIYSAFCKAYPNFFERTWFDVECGGMRGTTEGLKPEFADNAKYLGRYKIDVVGETKDFYAVVEVKGEATTKAMGELWLYDDLLREEWSLKKPVRCICLTDEEMPNVRTALEKEGYELIVVAPATTSSASKTPTQSEDQKERSQVAPVGATQTTPTELATNP